MFKCLSVYGENYLCKVPRMRAKLRGSWIRDEVIRRKQKTYPSQKFGNSVMEKSTCKGAKGPSSSQVFMKTEETYTIQLHTLCISHLRPMSIFMKVHKEENSLQNKKKWSVWQVPWWLGRQALHHRSGAPHSLFCAGCPIPESHSTTTPSTQTT